MSRHPLSPFLLAVVLVVEFAWGKHYENFQALGFGIYTGGAPAVMGKDLKCMANLYCPSRFFIGGVCWDCLIFNPVCECDKNALTCDKMTGFFGDPNFSDVQCYVGNENRTQDILGRIAVMEDAVEKAYEMASTDKRTLKIFNAPEFFWRGPRGSYSMTNMFETGGALELIIDALDNIAQQKRFEHWLFIFGTIVASEDIILSDGTNKTAYINVAPTLRGFDPATTNEEGMKMLVPKRYLSYVDFLADDRISAEPFVQDPYITQSEYDNTIWNSAAKYLEESDYFLLKDSWLIMDNIAMTIEICLDHAKGFAQNMYTRLRASQGQQQIPSIEDGAVRQVNVPTSMSQVSLVTSAGLTIEEKSLVLTNGGSLFLIDGKNPDNPRLITCSLGLLPDGYLGYGDCQSSTTADGTMTELSQPFDSYYVYENVTKASLALEGLFSMNVTDLPKIHVFDPIPIVPITTSVGGVPDPGRIRKG